MKIKLSLEAQLSLLCLTLIISIVTLVSLFNLWLNDILLAALLSTAFILPASLVVIRFYISPVNDVITALNDGFHNFLDNEFSVSIANTRHDELGELVDVYNRVSETLREERLHLYQRELLLDTVIQTTPLALVLTDNSQAIIYSNSSACQLFNGGNAINGFQLNDLLKKQPREFSLSINSGLSGLFTVSEKEGNETYHLTQNQFLLNGISHNLYLFKTLTREISRQEVNTWKKVIRLISHELNNSLAPVSSLAHSGQLLCNRKNDEQLEKIFSTIGERAKHLQLFLEGYAKFSRLPKPQIQAVNPVSFLNNLQQLRPFQLVIHDKQAEIYCDQGQIQQVIINLIKNAHESGSEPDKVTVELKPGHELFEIIIKDRGKGMTEDNLSNALLPFYSTKAEGTGLGLPLCREIIEAHGGKIRINNRQRGGLKITLTIPSIPEKGKEQADTSHTTIK